MFQTHKTRAACSPWLTFNAQATSFNECVNVSAVKTIVHRHELMLSRSYAQCLRLNHTAYSALANPQRDSVIVKSCCVHIEDF